jgi:hypothetical protein
MPREAMRTGRIEALFVTLVTVMLSFLEGRMTSSKKGALNVPDWETSYSLKKIIEGIAGAFLIAASLLTPFLRRWRTTWGATDEEVTRDLPGDGLVPQPRWGWTHAVTIRAATSEVWPWLVQMGHGRGGLYSYGFLENLVGFASCNADSIVPELQVLRQGDIVRLNASIGLPVALVEPRRALVLNARVDMQSLKPFDPNGAKPDGYINLSWAWFLEEVRGGTRLLSRWRADYSPSLANRLGFGPLMIEPASFAMDRKMLRGIKQRAEALARRGREQRAAGAVSSERAAS